MRERVLSAALCLSISMFGVTSTANAVQQIFSCDSTAANNYTTCTANCELITNITCNRSNPNHNGITLTNGADLNMKGWSITFTGTGNLKSAITVGANSTVKNTENDESKVMGLYEGTTPAIKCTTADNSKVSGIRVDISEGSGISGCEIVEDNVIISATTSAGNAVSGNYQASGTVVSNNYISGFYSAIFVRPGIVDNNFIQTSAGQDNTITAGSPGTGTAITDNIIMGPADEIIDLASGATASGNSCDTTTTACGTCVTNGHCRSAPVAPYVFP